MTSPEISAPVLDFLGRSPTPFHAVRLLAQELCRHGYTQLREEEPWDGLSEGRYLVLREHGSLAAFTLASDDPATTGWRMAGAHTDSPCLKLKPSFSRNRQNCVQAGVEVYGGALLAPWFDRDLSLAGRVVWRGENGSPGSGLIDFRKPLAVIPSLAIHLDRTANKNRSINPQEDLYVLLATSRKNASLEDAIIDQIKDEHPDATPCSLLGHDLFFYDTQPPALCGLDNEFITGSRLDNLLSCHLLIQGLLRAENRLNRLVLLCNHEETGSRTSSGALGTLASDILARLIPDRDERRQALSRSLFVSLDNAHAVHPNFTDRHDPQNLPELGRGPVIKWNSNQSYTSDAVTGGFFRELATREKIDCQDFVMRGDLRCGSTIGPFMASSLGVRSVDVGLPSLAMHSVRETAALEDLLVTTRLMGSFFSLDAGDPLWRLLSS